MAFGNPDGDFHMLQYAAAGPGPHFGLIVRHTDAECEWAYDRTSHVGKLDKAGRVVVDVKRDWRRVFAVEKP